MDRKVLAGLIGALLLACLVGAGFTALTMGMAGATVPMVGGVAPGVAPHAVYGAHFWGPGFLFFGLFGFLFKILFFIGILFLISRFFFWGRRGGFGPRMDWRAHQKELFEEWYREKEAQKNAGNQVDTGGTTSA